ncbi:LptE family protein [Kiritimatiellota bacterium B12222]|nr:LptE family protein [Kiritimatiellota bacterium B12222]
MSHFRTLALLPLLGLFLLQTGCQGYKLGSQLPDDIKTVYVPTVLNETNEPLLEGQITKAVMDRLQRDGSLKISNEQEADAILYVTVNAYKTNPLTYESSNTARPDEYLLTIGASIELVRRESGATIVKSTGLQGQDEFALVGDLTNAKSNALPDAADDLARYIVAAVTESWPAL